MKYKIDSETLTDIADAIRAKTGESGSMTPLEMPDEIASISGGGGDADLIAILDGTFSGAFSNNNITALKMRAFINLNSLTSVSLPNLTRLDQRVFEGSNNIEYFNLPELASCAAWAFASAGKNGCAIYLPKLASCDGNGLMEYSRFGVVVLPILGTFKNSALNGATYLSAVDSGVTTIGQNTFQNCNALTTVILRSTTLVTLDNVSAFNNNTFKSGGSGGTIYIPKTLYDHLGDGTASDYKAATNWSTIDGYGTITWAKIEGSQYETHYADGTVIPT